VASARASLSVARARIDALVSEIAGLMASGKWTPGETTAELAAREGMSVIALEKHAATAGRLLRLGRSEDAEAARGENVARLQRIAEKAEKARDYRSAVGAIAEEDKLRGLIVDRSIVVGANVSAGEIEAFRSAMVTELCECCRAKVLARVRAAKGEAA
jgi:hypothetical protein